MEQIPAGQVCLIEVRTESGLKMIAVKNIIYIMASGKFSIIKLEDKREIVSYQMLNWFEKYLSEPLFFRCHKSYIVNCRFVDCYCNKKITLAGKMEIPLSRYKTDVFKENLGNWLID